MIFFTVSKFFARKQQWKNKPTEGSPLSLKYTHARDDKELQRHITSCVDNSRIQIFLRGQAKWPKNSLPGPQDKEMTQVLITKAIAATALMPIALYFETSRGH